MKKKKTEKTPEQQALEETRRVLSNIGVLLANGMFKGSEGVAVDECLSFVGRIIHETDAKIKKSEDR